MFFPNELFKSSTTENQVHTIFSHPKNVQFSIFFTRIVLSCHSKTQILLCFLAFRCTFPPHKYFNQVLRLLPLLYYCNYCYCSVMQRPRRRTTVTGSLKSKVYNLHKSTSKSIQCCVLCTFLQTPLCASLQVQVQYVHSYI